MMNKVPTAINTQRLRSLLRKLVDIYSPSGKEEEILSFLHTFLKRHGLPVFHQPVDDNRHNILIIPPETDIQIVLVGHVDTVSAYDLDHLGYDESGDMLSGLGAADMKGGCAAMIEAYLNLWARHPRPPVALALVVGEEEEGDGAQKLAREYHFPWALIGEPTNLHPCLSHYGYVEVQLTTTGKRVHASLANSAQNPVEAMLRLLLKITHYIGEQRPEVVYNIRGLSSSNTGFAVPDACEAWLDIHLPPVAPLEEITLDLEEILIRERNESQGFNGSLRFATIHTGYSLPEKGTMVEMLKATMAGHSLPWAPEPFRSHSDANILWANGTKPILLGPGELEMAHTPDEEISLKEVYLAAQLYLDLLTFISS
jgi:acetylornithine deacetylase